MSREKPLSVSRPMWVLRSIWRKALDDDMSGVEAQALEYESVMGREAFERQWRGAQRLKRRLMKRLA